jgi:acyl carrier protein
LKRGRIYERKIIALIEEVLMLSSGSITEETLMDDVEAWDSLAHVIIIGELEEKLGISIPLDEAIEITSVKEILEKAGV